MLDEITNQRMQLGSPFNQTLIWIHSHTSLSLLDAGWDNDQPNQDLDSLLHQRLGYHLVHKHIWASGAACQASTLDIIALSLFTNSHYSWIGRRQCYLWTYLFHSFTLICSKMPIVEAMKTTIFSVACRAGTNVPWSSHRSSHRKSSWGLSWICLIFVQIAQNYERNHTACRAGTECFLVQ